MKSDVYFSGNKIYVKNLPYGVKKLILNKPENRNAFDAEMIFEISLVLKKLKQIDDPNEMRILILQGEGKVFCAGADLNYMKQQALKNIEENILDADHLAKMFYLLADFPTPTISSVKGAAIGGGLGLIACSDYTIANENTVFATSEVQLGIVPAVISPYIIRKVGVGFAAPFLLSGKRMTADECLRSGLIYKVTSQDKHEDDLNKIVKELLMAAPYAARSTKELIKNYTPLPNEYQIEFTKKSISCARSSHEGQTGLNSFFEKSTPYWCDGIK